MNPMTTTDPRTECDLIGSHLMNGGICDRCGWKSPDDTTSELRQLEKDLAASFESFRLAEGAYMSGTSASSQIAAQQFTQRFESYFAAQKQRWEAEAVKKELKDIRPGRDSDLLHLQRIIDGRIAALNGELGKEQADV